MKTYFWNVLIALDQLGNTITGGDPDETLSSRWGKSQGAFPRLMCRLLHIVDPEHCKKSIEADEGKNASF